MNIEMAKRIPIIKILEILGFKPQRETKLTATYLSPIRKEHEGSFVVYKKTNTWYDYGIAKGRDTLDLVQQYLGHTGADCTIQDCFRWLDNMVVKHHNFPTFEPIEDGFECKHQIISVKEIQHPALKKFLEYRKISLSTARRYTKEVRVIHTGTQGRVFALGFPNEGDGFELRCQIFKGSVKEKTISFVRGFDEDYSAIYIFEGFMDFLSAVEQNGMALKHDAIILNSTTLLKVALGYIEVTPYKTIKSWMDNDRTGNNAKAAITAFVNSKPGMEHLPMNIVYAGYKDVNAWHMANPKELGMN